MRAQHLDTTFGRVWLVLNPLLLAGVYFILVDILRHGHRKPHYLPHLIAGIFAYYFVSGTIRQGAKAVTKGGNLVLNTAFPRILLPASSVIDNFMRFLPTLLIYAVIHVISGLPVGPSLLLLVPVVLMLTGVAAGISLFVSALQVYFRDLAQFLPYMLRMWLYLSPVLWFADEAPHGFKWLIWVNPIGSLLAAWSDILIKGEVPSLFLFGLGFAWMLVSLLLGSLFFMSREREFAIRL